MILAEIIDELLRRRHRLADERPERPQDQPVVAVVASQEQRPVSGREAVRHRRMEDIDPLQEMELRRRQRRNRRVLARSILRFFELAQRGLSSATAEDARHDNSAAAFNIAAT